MKKKMKAALAPFGLRFALGIGGLYAVLGVVWILASDGFVASISDSRHVGRDQVGAGL